MYKKILGIFLAAVLLLPCTALAKETNTLPYRITVNLTKNIVTVYGKDSAGGYTIPERAFVCSAGSATPTGTFRTTDKYTWRPLFGNVYGQYATRITGSILFHSVPYLKQDKSTLEYDEYNKLGATASAGCIRLTAANAKWIYDNCPSGTVVEMYRSSKTEPLTPEPPAKIDTSDSRRGWDPTDPDPANPWRNSQAEQTRNAEIDEPETVPEWLEPLLSESPEKIEPLAQEADETPPEWLEPLLSESPVKAEPAALESAARQEMDEAPPEWLEPLLNQTQETASASAETETQGSPLPELFKLQASGWKTTYTVKGVRTDTDCFLLEQDARQAFAHLGITLLFQRQGNGTAPLVLCQKTLYNVPTLQTGGQTYYSLRELAGLMGAEAVPVPNGGFSLRRQDSKVWIDPFTTA